MSEARDLVIVGAGPSGLAAALAAHRAGLDAVVLEKGVLVNSIFNFPAHMTFFTTADLLEIGGLPFVSLNDKPTRVEGLKYYRRVAEVESLDVALGVAVRGLRRAEGGGFEVSVRSAEGDAVLRARHVVVATGYYDTPNLLGVPGEDLPHVSHYYDEPHPFFRRPVVVVGGKNSAAIAALELFRAGAAVTLVHRGPALGDSIKYWIRPDIENRIKEGAIAARLSTRVLGIARDAVHVRGPQGDERLPADAVFLLTGYCPDTSLLEGAGVRVDPATLIPDHDATTMETNVPGLYVAGSTASGRFTSRIFIETGRFHGEAIVAHILATRSSDPRALPGS
jgi:thioredoxin reductase (NADPH)